MPLSTSDTSVYRRDVASKGAALSARERENLIKPYLPPPEALSRPKASSKATPTASSNGTSSTVHKHHHKQRIRPFLRAQLHILIYFIIHLLFGIYIRLRQIYVATVNRILGIVHYHHRTPAYIQKDVKSLSRVPEHLSVVLKFKTEQDGSLEALMDEVAELSAWSAAAGIGLLSVYEKSGVLKSYMPGLHELVKQKLEAYFGTGPTAPRLRLFAPNHASMNGGGSAGATPSSVAAGGVGNGVGVDAGRQKRQVLNLLLLSATDGRDTLVDLTRTLTEMVQSKKIKARDITSDLINTEISATTAVPGAEVGNGGAVRSATKTVDAGEPDLVIVFGPYVKLDGYPPWQIRLSEIFCVGDSGGDVSGSGTRVEYQAFLRGLWKYAGAEFRLGA